MMYNLAYNFVETLELISHFPVNLDKVNAIIWEAPDVLNWLRSSKWNRILEHALDLFIKIILEFYVAHKQRN